MRLLLLLGLVGVGVEGWAAKLRVMTYNVENLFDAKDDPGKKDETYLPIEKKKNKAHQASCKKISRPHWRDQCLSWDWGEKAVATKIQRLKQVIQARWKDGPDILILQEVENDSILKRLQEALGGYPYRILLEGNDVRGIDVAVLTRLASAGKPRLEKVSFSRKFNRRAGDTRPLLVVPLKTDRGVLSVIGVHFPAPFHPTGMREEAFARLNRVASQELKAGRSVLAAGDFNIPQEEDSALYRGVAAVHWQVSHLMGCHTCLGTSYYAPKKSWSFLDAILTHRKNPAWGIEGNSVRLTREVEGQTRRGVPNGMEFKGGTLQGVSDHYPVSLTLSARGG